MGHAGGKISRMDYRFEISAPTHSDAPAQFRVVRRGESDPPYVTITMDEYKATENDDDALIELYATKLAARN